MKSKTIDYQGTKITISDDGNIVIWNGKKRNIYYNADGYSVCSIKIPNVGWRSVRVARLVAMAFIPNPENLPEVNHKDYNRKNSKADNLEWISRIENVRYSKCNRTNYHGKNNPNYGNKKLSKIYSENKTLAREKQGRPGVKNGRAKKISLYFDDNLIETFDYIGQCAQYMVSNGISNCKSKNGVRGQISECVHKNKVYKKHYNFKFV